MAQCESCIQIKKKRIKRRKLKRKENEEQTESESVKEGERKMKNGFFCFSLKFIEIGPSIFVGAKRKVDSRIESYAWVPKFWSFVKLCKVKNFPTLVISNLKRHLMA